MLQIVAFVVQAQEVMLASVLMVTKVMIVIFLPIFACSIRVRTKEHAFQTEKFTFNANVLVDLQVTIFLPYVFGKKISSHRER